MKSKTQKRGLNIVSKWQEGWSRMNDEIGCKSDDRTIYTQHPPTIFHLFILFDIKYINYR